MGVATKTRGAGARRRRLAKLAEPLKPDREPYYVDWTQATNLHAAPGWYMVPHGLEHPIYLGAGSIQAEIALREHRRVAGVDHAA